MIDPPISSDPAGFIDRLMWAAGEDGHPCLRDDLVNLADYIRHGLRAHGTILSILDRADRAARVDELRRLEREYYSQYPHSLPLSEFIGSQLEQLEAPWDWAVHPEVDR